MDDIAEDTNLNDGGFEFDTTVSSDDSPDIDEVLGTEKSEKNRVLDAAKDLRNVLSGYPAEVVVVASSPAAFVQTEEQFGATPTVERVADRYDLSVTWFDNGEGCLEP